ncbi:MAG: sodium:proton antiporter [Firmicutes bacterium]|nr:sodium:proton antiporter [Bacillota bacterium]HOB34993.1 MnhB domain-containing protein [Bacillota bacterium]HQE02168.1 MnhB domain-containing protein [Bacillota bacterium]
MPDKILREITSLLLPFIQMYGIYVVFHGHLSPGGGFAGGMVLGVSLVLYILVFGLDSCLRKIPHHLSSALESFGTLWYAAVGFVGLLRGASFLMNKGAGIDVGTPGELFSGGLIFIITIGVGVKVASTMLSLFYTLVEED